MVRWGTRLLRYRGEEKVRVALALLLEDTWQESLVPPADPKSIRMGGESSSRRTQLRTGQQIFKIGKVLAEVATFLTKPVPARGWASTLLEAKRVGRSPGVGR